MDPLAGLLDGPRARGAFVLRSIGAGGFGNALSDLARLIKGGAGVEVATVDVGGFDPHTDEANDLDRVLGGWRPHWPASSRILAHRRRR
jgi:uncharacterized protein (DUF1501 family)